MKCLLSSSVVLFLTLLNTPSARAFVCDNGKAEIGDSKYEIVHKCGEPTYKDQTQVSRFSEGREAYKQDFVTVDYWLYNLGSDRFVTIVTFEKGDVVGMRAYGYGRSRGEDPDIRKTVEIGCPAVMLLFLYGPPTHKEERIETSVISLKGGATLPKMTHVEEWTYNLGPNRLMRIYHFENGRLKKIEQGNRGF
jgi:hypothetical protein